MAAAAPGPADPAGELRSELPPVVDIKPLLKRLWPQNPDVTADEISDAIAHFFTDRIDPVQTGALLMCLHFTGLDRDPKVLSQCAQKMLKAAAQVDSELLERVIQMRGRKEGSYRGGFVSQALHALCTTRAAVYSAHALTVFLSSPKCSAT